MKKNNISKEKNDDYEVIWIDSDERGLSKSRNLAIKNSKADICLIADDDMIYANQYKNIILEQFNLHTNYDILVFQIEGINKKFKKYNKKSKDINFINSMKISSVEIAFRRKKIVENNIEFNELFGAGAKYYCGEENIFLYDAIRKKMKIKYIPIKIADIYLGDSTWFEGYNNRYFITKGAAFTAMSKLFSIPLILQFAFRKRKLYKERISTFKVISLMLYGKKEYLETLANTNI